MIIACIGDSLTEGDYGIFGKRCIANIQEKGYPYFLAEISGAQVRNYGKCGLGANSILPLYRQGQMPVGDADIIVIMLGTNGGHDPIEQTPENKAYYELVDACRIDAPNASLVLCTPPHATQNPSKSNCGYAPQVEKAVLFVRNYAEKQHLPLIDVALCPDFTAENEHIMQPNDGLHFGEVGYRVMAEYIYNGLKRLFPERF